MHHFNFVFSELTYEEQCCRKQLLKCCHQPQVISSNVLATISILRMFLVDFGLMVKFFAAEIRDVAYKKKKILQLQIECHIVAAEIYLELSKPCEFISA